MKKLLLAFAILGFVACNNEGESKSTTTDTPVVAPPVVDTPKVDTPKVDTPKVDTPKVAK